MKKLEQGLAKRWSVPKNARTVGIALNGERYKDRNGRVYSQCKETGQIVRLTK